MGRYTTASLLSIFAFVITNTAQGALIAHWSLDEAPSATIAHDSVAAVNGTLANSAHFVAGGVSGNAIQLSSVTNDYITMGDNFGFTSGSFTITAWIKTTMIPDGFPAGKHLDGTQNGYALNINSGSSYGVAGKAYFYASANSFQTPISLGIVSDGAWHQLVGTYNPSGNMSLYVDGIFQASSPSTPVVGTTAPFMIGASQTGGQPLNRFTGLIDDVQLYNTELTGPQVSFLFLNPGATVPEPSAILTLSLGSAFLLRRSRKKD